MKYLYAFGAAILAFLGIYAKGRADGSEKIKEKSRKKADKTQKRVNNATISAIAEADEEVKDAIANARKRRNHFS